VKYNDALDAPELRSEEDVKVHFLLPYLKKLGYKTEHCEFEKTITVHEGRKQKQIYADVIVYSSAKHTAPLILCETKAPREVLNPAAREQAISYARLLDRIAPLVLLTNGLQVQVYQTLNKNRLESLPRRDELSTDILKFVVPEAITEALRAEAKHQLFIIDDVQTFKNVLQNCHNVIRNNEGMDPTEAFDEMSKILFCKLYEERRTSKTRGQQNRFRLSVFDETLENIQVNVVKKIFEETKVDQRFESLFSADAQINLSDRTIRRIVQSFENFDLSLTAFDVKGEAFEYFLGDTFTGGLGEYFTPRNVVEFMVNAMDPKIKERIVDPFCGTGGFLLYSFEVVNNKIRMNEVADDQKERWRLELSNESLFGTDWKERTSQACKMNMTVHGDGSAGIFMHDGLTDVPGVIIEDSFDLCLTNPPFGSFETDPKVLKRYELGAGRNTQDRVILAVERSIKLTKPGKRIAIIVIDGILNNVSMKYVRDFIRREAHVLGVVSLAKETFEGYGARAKTSVLFLERRKPGDTTERSRVFMAIASNTGYAPNGAPVSGNQLPDILLDYQAFVAGKEPAYSKSAWVASLQERLDAEFYWRKTSLAASTDELATLSADVKDRVAEMSAALANFNGRLAALSRKPDMVTKTIADICEEVTDSRELLADQTYSLLGVRWWGGGAFVRETKLGSKIKARKHNRVQPGWIIYNRLFAFRGSFAVTRDEHDGCYVSNEFPTFIVKGGLYSEADEYLVKSTVARYIIYLMTSDAYLAVIDAQSTGSTKTSRNRFNQELFRMLQVNMPKDFQALREMVRVLDESERFAALHDQMRDLVKSLRKGAGSVLPPP
jgi:type I restriction enzyme M protein